ncbi:hypothetical protein [Streptomyces sp. NPDC047974]|uniref:SCO4225 family membrane protein n=1 Tax=Streptomyces sp. NPDC047974 TaxID=3154343 RepID=UPI0034048E49
MPTAPHPRREPLPRRLLTLAAGNRLARAYLAVFAVSLIVTFLAPESPFAGSSLLLTAPLSFLPVFVPVGPGAGIDGVADVAGVAAFALWHLLCALVNAAALGALATRSAALRPAGPREARRPGVRALLAPAVDNWPARVYLAVVAVALGFFLCAAYVLPDPGFAGIYPLMATAPLGFVALAVSSPVEFLSSAAWLSPLVFSLGVALAGLVNAVLLGLLTRRLRPREPRPAT